MWDHLVKSRFNVNNLIIYIYTERFQMKSFSTKFFKPENQWVNNIFLLVGETKSLSQQEELCPAVLRKAPSSLAKRTVQFLTTFICIPNLLCVTWRGKQQINKRDDQCETFHFGQLYINNLKAKIRSTVLNSKQWGACSSYNVSKNIPESVLTDILWHGTHTEWQRTHLFRS